MKLIKDVRDWVSYATLAYLPHPSDFRLQHSRERQSRERESRNRRGRSLVAEQLEPRHLLAADVSIEDPWQYYDESFSYAYFTVTLSEEVDHSVTVYYKTSSGTASEDEDFVGATSSVTFAPYEIVQEIQIEIIDDSIYNEDTEYFYVELTSATGGVGIGNDTAIGYITDTTEASPGASFSLGNETEYDEDAGTIYLTVELEGESATPITVHYHFSQGDSVWQAEFEDDYDSSEPPNQHGYFELYFAAGETQKQIAIEIIDDDLDEDYEDFRVEIVGGHNVVPGNDHYSEVITISDNDAPPTVEFDDDVSVGEDEGYAEFTVKLSEESGKYVTVEYELASVTAHIAADYEYYEPSTLIVEFEPGETSKTIKVSIANDSIDEYDETFKVILGDPVDAVLGDKDEATGTIQDNDDPPEIRIFDASNTEMGSLEFLVELSGESEKYISVDYATVSGTALATYDFAPSSDTLTFCPGQTQKYITIPINDDTIDEPTEYFTVELSNPTNVTIFDGIGQGTILDDEDPPYLTFSGGEFVTSEGHEYLRFWVDLAEASGHTVTVKYKTVDDTAKKDKGYKEKTGTLTFAPGETSEYIDVEMIDDFVGDEWDERFYLELHDPTNAQLDPETYTTTAVGRIIDNDQFSPEYCACMCACEPTTYLVDAQTGAVQVSHRLTTGFDAWQRLLYNSLANGDVVLAVNTNLPAYTPSAAYIKVTLEIGNETLEAYFDPQWVSIDDKISYRFQIPAGELSTGLHDWEMTIKAYKSDDELIDTRSVKGNIPVLNRDDSPFGAQWWLSGLQQLSAVDGGMLLFTDAGAVVFFAAEGGGFKTPEGYDYELTHSGGGYRLSTSKGDHYEFNGSGKQTRYVDANDNATEYTYTGNLLTEVSNQHNRSYTLDYSGGKLSSITDDAGRVTSFEHSGIYLVKIVDPDPDDSGPQEPLETEFTYSSGLLTEIDSDGVITSFTYARGRASGVSTATVGPAWLAGVPNLDADQATYSNPYPLGVATALFETSGPSSSTSCCSGSSGCTSRTVASGPGRGRSRPELLRRRSAWSSSW